MAIVTGDLYKGFTFGDISSKAYGVYITQEAAYNAPDRDVEVVEIAGRNGAYILDKGRFKNITVSYKCGIALDDEQSFESAIRTFRNALSSKAGKYVRLEDEYNPNEYRQAAFLGGIEVDMADRRAGEFTVSFDAMPQRFLKSGETAVSIASGGQITNPTLFESHPLLDIVGYGAFTINDGKSMKINANRPLGNIVIWDGNIPPDDSEQYLQVGQNRFNADDTFTLDARFTLEIYGYSGFSDGTKITVAPAGDVFKVVSGSVNKSFDILGNNGVIYFSLYTENPLEFTIGTWKTYQAYITITTTKPSTTLTIDFQIAYEPNNNRVIIGTKDEHYDDNVVGMSGTASGNSTLIPLSETYFDLDIGEAYRIVDGETVSANNIVTIPAQLPTLKSGANTITYDDTITQFKVVPRWWEV